MIASITGVAKAPHHMKGAMCVCGATNATKVAAKKMPVAKIGATTLSGWPRGTHARTHRTVFNPLITAKWEDPRSRPRKRSGRGYGTRVTLWEATC